MIDPAGTLVFTSQSADNQGRKIIDERIYSGDTSIVFSGTGGPVQRVYEWLKTLPDYEGAQDV